MNVGFTLKRTASSIEHKKEREIENEYKLEIPSARFANPEEIASATCFLCSNEVSYINGINLPVDGGYSVTL